MNTHGHREIAQEAGLPLLKETFGSALRSLEAMHLGNWLTDVSQAVDPVSGKKMSAVASTAVDEFRSAIDGFAEQLLGAMVEYLPGTAGDSAERVIKRMRDIVGDRGNEAKKLLVESIDYIFAGQSNDRDSNLGKFFRESFLVIGYFKFVHPESTGSRPRMDFECYMRVFGRPNDTRGAAGKNPAFDRAGAYTQYYPHEHLDRPELLPARTPPVYSPGIQVKCEENAVKAGTRPGTRAAKNQRYIRPDLYSYLRDDMEMVAGLLAEVDREIRRLVTTLRLKPPFDGHPKLSSLDQSTEFHLCLAKLGHALHQVEDFFAHSNWVELAVMRRGEDYLEKLLPKMASQQFLSRSRTLVAKRLRRHLTTAMPDWRDHDCEHWVTTGYFDRRDTVVSLLHLTEEAWGGAVPHPFVEANQELKKIQEAREKPSVIVAAAQRLLRESLDFLIDPKAAQEDAENDVARLYKERRGDDLERFDPKTVAKRIARETPLLANIPLEIREAFLTALELGSRLEGGVGLYKSIKAIAEFVLDPIVSFLKQAPEKVRDPFVYDARERVYDAIAMDRIGCHSLMAKDHGPEPLYEPNKQCATAVHYFVVKTLLRFRDENAPVHIDWLALLEFFLQNPTGADKSRRPPVKLSVTINHVVKEGEQLDTPTPNSRFSLTARYRRTAVDPTTFSWRTIADANFNTYGLTDEKTQRIVNATLRDRGWGVKVGAPNYAFKPGLIIRIPGQRVESDAMAALFGDAQWYDMVMDKGWKVFKGGADPESGIDTPPLEPYKPLAVSRSTVDSIIAKGRRMRIEARQQYRPTQS